MERQLRLNLERIKRILILKCTVNQQEKNKLELIDKLDFLHKSVLKINISKNKRILILNFIEKCICIIFSDYDELEINAEIRQQIQEVNNDLRNSDRRNKRHIYIDDVKLKIFVKQVK